MSQKKDIDINEALNEFYKLKSTYETGYYEKYIKPIISSKGKSKREKRADYSKLPKPECINCKRNVGTLFSIKKNADEYVRVFIAKCGDLVTPCPLNINIEYAERHTFDSQMVTNDKDLNEIKMQIIKDKNNMMFGYIDENTAVKKFTEKTDELKDLTEIAGYVINTNIVINDSPEEKMLLKNLENDFGESYLMPFKNMISEYKDSNGQDKGLINSAVGFYVNEMIPKIREIQALKYETEYIHYDASENTSEKYLLFQRKNNLEKLELNFFSKDVVNSFVKGLLENASNAIKNVNNKTRKKRANIEFVEEPVSPAPVSPAPSPEYAPTSQAPSPEYAPTSQAPSPEYAPTSQAPSPEYAPTSQAPSPEYAPTSQAPSPEYAPTSQAPSPEYAPMESPEERPDFGKL